MNALEFSLFISIIFINDYYLLYKCGLFSDRRWKSIASAARSDRAEYLASLIGAGITERSLAAVRAEVRKR